MFFTNHFKFIFPLIWFTFLFISGFLLINDKIDRKIQYLYDSNEINFRYVKFKIDCLGKDADIIELTREFIKDSSKYIPASIVETMLNEFENDTKHLRESD